MEKELGDVAILRKTRKGILLSPGETRDFMDEFRGVMLSEPRRTGIPENPPAQEMKAIWYKVEINRQATGGFHGCRRCYKDF